MMIIIMGVCGSGKTTVGKLLARSLDAKFLEGDDFHPQANIKKMQDGFPLTDEDRWPWLAAMAAAADQWQGEGLDVVLSCSALKQSYRKLLMKDGKTRLVYLKGKEELLRQRLERRPSHFMPASLLESQLAALEEPKNALIMDVSLLPEAIAVNIRKAIE